MKVLFAAVTVSACLVSGAAFAKDTQFWNLTANTITKLEMSPTGKDAWGADQTANDNDHSVDHDERLKIKDVTTGAYDVRFTDKTGRHCVVKNVAVKQGAVFSIAEKGLADCTH